MISLTTEDGESSGHHRKLLHNYMGATYVIEIHTINSHIMNVGDVYVVYVFEKMN